MNDNQDLKEGSMEEVMGHLKSVYEAQPKVQIGFDIAELKVINLAPGDVLSVKLIGDDFNQEITESLQTLLVSIFPNNKVVVFTMPTNSDIMMEVIKQAPKVDCSDPVSFCSDCNCGKKEQIEGKSDER